MAKKKKRKPPKQDPPKSSWGRLERLAVIIAPSLAFIAAVVGATFTLHSHNKELRLKTITNLKTEFASTSHPVRISAVYALADYEESIPILLKSLGATKTIQEDGKPIQVEDTDFTLAVVSSLLQIGKKPVKPLIQMLWLRQREMRGILRIGEDKFETSTELIQLPHGLAFPEKMAEKIHYDEKKKLLVFKGIMNKDEVYELLGLAERDPYYRQAVRGLLAQSQRVPNICLFLPLTMLLNEDEGADDIVTGSVRKEIEAITEWTGPDLNDEEIDNIATRLAQNLKSIRSSKPEAVIANRNGVPLLASMLRTYRIKGLKFLGIDLSGADMRDANLAGADLRSATLSGANLQKANLSGANLQKANLLDAKLQYADLSDARLWFTNLAGAYLFGADLSSADLSGADLTNVTNFKRVKSLKEADLTDVEGLSKEDLEFAKSKGAIIVDVPPPEVIDDWE